MSARVSDNTASSAPLVTVVSGSGGVGKTTIALVGAWLASEAGIPTALVEADLQFGDIGYWLGLDDELPNLGAGMACEPVHLTDNLALYKAPSLPEVAESVADDVAHLAQAMRRAYGLVIADTGGFWSGLTADLAVNASLLLNVMDARPSSVMSAVRVQELCARMGVASSRCVAVCNRYSSRSRLSAREVQSVLGADDVLCVGDGRAVVDALLVAGSVEELLDSGNAAVRGLDELLCSVLPRVGCLYGGAAPSPKRGLFR